MTLPNLLGNYEKKVTVNRLKKVYSLLQQSINMAYLKYGEETFMPACNSAFDCYIALKDRKYLIEELNPTPCGNILNDYKDGLKNMLGVGGYSYMVPDDECYVLKDGTIFFVYSYGYVIYTLDINGVKKPNRLGKDMFVFIFVPSSHMPYPNMLFGDPGSKNRDFGGIRTKDGLRPGLYASGYEKDGDGKDMCKKYPSGGCTNKIIKDGWHIKDDYPW